MADPRRRIAWTLSRAAQALPPAERQGFRAFLAALPGARPKRRKVHSWRRKRRSVAIVKIRVRRSKIRAADRQLEMPFAAPQGVAAGASQAASIQEI